MALARWFFLTVSLPRSRVDSDKFSTAYATSEVSVPWKSYGIQGTVSCTQMDGSGNSGSSWTQFRVRSMVGRRYRAQAYGVSR